MEAKGARGLSPRGDGVTTGDGFLGMSVGRLHVRLHLLVPVVVAVLAWRWPDLARRYALLLGTLLLHEAAHAAACLALRGERAVVRIWPFFGRVDVAVAPGGRRALTALAGPAANLLCALGAGIAGGRFSWAIGSSGPLDLLLTAHLLMGLLNLLPLRPLDGGLALSEFRRSGRSGGGAVS